MFNYGVINHKYDGNILTEAEMFIYFGQARRKGYNLITVRAQDMGIFEHIQNTPSFDYPFLDCRQETEVNHQENENHQEEKLKFRYTNGVLYMYSDNGWLNILKNKVYINYICCDLLYQFLKK